MSEKMTGEEAIAFVRECKKAKKRVFGVDGFVVVARGFEAKLDMILDVSSGLLDAEQTAVAAEEFIRTHANRNVVFEVCIE